MLDRPMVALEAAREKTTRKRITFKRIGPWIEVKTYQFSPFGMNKFHKVYLSRFMGRPRRMLFTLGDDPLVNSQRE